MMLRLLGVTIRFVHETIRIMNRCHSINSLSPDWLEVDALLFVALYHLWQPPPEWHLPSAPHLKTEAIQFIISGRVHRDVSTCDHVFNVVGVPRTIHVTIVT